MGQGQGQGGEQDRVSIDETGFDSSRSSNGHPSGVTLDDVEVALWRSLGLQETEVVDRILKVVTAYGDGRAHKAEMDQEWKRAVENPGTWTKAGIYLAPEPENAVIRLGPFGEGVREELSEDQKAWWDAGRRPQAWNSWQGYTQWTLPKGEVFGKPVPGTFVAAVGEAEEDPGWFTGTLPRPSDEASTEMDSSGPNCGLLPVPRTFEETTTALRTGAWPEQTRREDLAEQTIAAHEAMRDVYAEAQDALKEAERKEWPFNLVGDEDGHPPVAGEPYAKDGHPPFSQEGDDDLLERAAVDEDVALFDLMLAEVVQEARGGGETVEGRTLKCSGCGLMKVETQFAIDRSRPRGRRWKCRACEKEYRKKWNKG